MSNVAGPRPVIIDRFMVPCSCNHGYQDHKRCGGHCKSPDSYGFPCECPSYEADENVIADLTGDN